MDGKVGVIGLGYVGLPLLAAFSNVGLPVVGFDVNQTKIEELTKKYEADIYEPGLNAILKRNKERIEFTTDGNHLMGSCSTIFITVGTPICEDSKPDYSFLDSAIKTIGWNLRSGQGIVLKSTVVPGTTEDYVVPKLEEMSGLKPGVDFFVAYAPERTIEGLTIHELYSLPKIIGGINKESTEHAAKVIRKLGGKIIKVSSPKVAELCKIYDNIFRATNIALANEVGMVCEKSGIDSYELISAVNKSYDRTLLYLPGLGADGPCLSKDPYILKHYMDTHNIPSELLDACNTKNKFSTDRVADMVVGFVKTKNILKPKVTIIGLAFKGFPETDDFRGSSATRIFTLLREKLGSCEFSFCDPIIEDFFENNVHDKLEEATEGSHVILLLTNHNRFKNIHLKALLERTERPLFIFDVWHNITSDYKHIPADVEVFRVGDGRR